MGGYVGGKYKVCRQISEHINSLSPCVYLEPFCGYCWIAERVRARDRFLCDLNQDVILMWEALLRGWKPPSVVTEEEYEQLRNAAPSAMRGFVSTACSFSGKWFGGFQQDKHSDRNYAKNAANQMRRRVPGLRGAVFQHRDYRVAIESTKADVIYCDPPYADTVGYDAVESFDSAAFWDNIRRWSDGSRRILVSEYQAPSDFTCMLTAHSRMGLRTTDGQELREEKVYEYQPPKGRRMVSFATWGEMDAVRQSGGDRDEASL